MKKGLYWISILILVSALLLAVGGNPATAQVIKLRWSTWTTVEGANPETGRWWMDRVKSLTNNRVEFETHYVGSLIPGGEDVALVGKGVADISMLFTPFLGEACPLTSVVNVPGLQTNPLAFNLAFSDLVQMQELKDEYAKNNLMVPTIQGGSPRHIISRKPIRNLAELKGVKIRALGDEAKVIGQLGATPLGLKSNECYEALERGTIDAVVVSPAGVDAWKLYEVAKNYTIWGTSYDGFMFIMNLNSWNKLPADIQKVFLQLSQEMPKKFYDHYYLEGEQKRYLEDLFPKKGVTIFQLPETEKVKYAKATEPLFDAWIKKQEARGLPGRKIVDEWLKLNQKYLK